MENNEFNKLKLSDNVRKAIEALEYSEMTPIQTAALPIVLEGKDIVAQAPTGTGKTCCYAIPAIELVDTDNPNVQVMILCPTRELAIQVTNEIKKLSRYVKDFRTLTVYGGQEIEIQIKALKRNPQVIVGTPGRIMDHMRRRTLKINDIKMLVLDEADEMLNMGFREDLDVILKDVNPMRQTLLFSATMPNEIKRITNEYQHEAVFVKTTIQETDLPQINQYYVELLEGNKTDCLSRMIDVYNFKQALVFCRTKRKVDELSFALTSRGYTVECLHGDLKQAGREKVMEMFRTGMVRVLIATDVAARGLDITGIDVVFNYDISDDVEYYIHRIGRTARAGRPGSSYTFVNRKEVSRIKEFARVTKCEINKITPPTYEEAETAKIGNILAELIQSLEGQDLNTYRDYIYTALLKSDTFLEIEDVAAGFLKKLIEVDKRFKDPGLNLEISTNSKHSKTSEGYERIFINLGRKDNLNKAELVNLLYEKRLVDREQIQGIDIMNTYSFFEVPKAKVETLIEEIKGAMFNGRKIDLEISKGEKKISTSRSNQHQSNRSTRPRRSEEVIKEPRKRTNDTTKVHPRQVNELKKKPSAQDRGVKDKFKTEHSKRSKTSSKALNNQTNTLNKRNSRSVSKPRRNSNIEIKW